MGYCKSDVLSRISRFSQPNLARLAAVLADCGCSDIPGYEPTEPRPVGDGEAYWFDYSAPTVFSWFDEQQTVLATALPGYIGRLDSPHVLEALTGFMKGMALKHFPHVGKCASPPRYYLACYCLCDIGWDYAVQVSTVFEKAMSDMQDQLGMSFSQFGPLPLETLHEVYGSFEKIHKTCTSMLETYHRFALLLDGQRVRVICLELAGIAGSEQQSQEAVVVNIVPSAGPFEGQRSALEELVNSTSASEQDVARFFKTNASLLNFLGTDVRAYFHVGLYRPDCLLEPITHGHAAVVDMGLPSEKLVLRSEQQEQFYASLFQYIVRMREGRMQFNAPDWSGGIESFEPECVLIIGKDYGQWDYAFLQPSWRSVYPVRLPPYMEVLSARSSVDARDMSTARTA